MNHANHKSSELVTDPACGMRIDPASAAATLEWQGQRVHFCSQRCASKFRVEPERYPLVPSGSKPATGRCCG